MLQRSISVFSLFVLALTGPTAQAAQAAAPKAVILLMQVDHQDPEDVESLPGREWATSLLAPLGRVSSASFGEGADVLGVTAKPAWLNATTLRVKLTVREGNAVLAAPTLTIRLGHEVSTSMRDGDDWLRLTVRADLPKPLKPLRP